MNKRYKLRCNEVARDIGRTPDDIAMWAREAKIDAHKNGHIWWISLKGRNQALKIAERLEGR